MAYFVIGYSDDDSNKLIFISREFLPLFFKLLAVLATIFLFKGLGLFEFPRKVLLLSQGEAVYTSSSYFVSPLFAYTRMCERIPY